MVLLETKWWEARIQVLCDPFRSSLSLMMMLFSLKSHPTPKKHVPKVAYSQAKGQGLN